MFTHPIQNVALCPDVFYTEISIKKKKRTKKERVPVTYNLGGESTTHMYTVYANV